MKSKILKTLSKSNNHISGEEMSRQLKMSRAAVWKYIEELRRDGYQIDAVSNRGYLLKDSPDTLFAHAIEQGLQTKYCGRTIHYFDSIPTTMSEAFQLAMNDAPEGTLVVADHQTKGKGRFDRSWKSQRGKGIYCSLILRPNLSAIDIPKLTLMTAVVLYRAIKQCTQLETTIKWPNDIFLSDKKVAGILTEMHAQMERIHFVVIGIGVNVNQSPSGLLDSATSLKKEFKKEVNRVRLLQMILKNFEEVYDQVKQDGFNLILEEYHQHSRTIGQKVKLVDQQNSVSGEAIGIDEFGGLVIRTKDGSVVRRMTGDVYKV